MPSLRNILHKRDELSSEKQSQEPQQTQPSPPTPEITFMRTTTNTQEIITPPTYADEFPPVSPISPESRPSLSNPRRSFSFLHRSSRSGSVSSPSPSRTRERRLSSLLHLDGRHRSESRNSSANIPADLPQILDEQGDREAREEAWERRATVLVQQNPQFGQLSPRSSEADLGSEKGMSRSSSQGNMGVQDDVSFVVDMDVFTVKMLIIVCRLIFRRLFGYMRLEVGWTRKYAWLALVLIIFRSGTINANVRPIG